MIVALDGGDAAGKATQAKILVERLRAEGYIVNSMSFPDYGSATGRLIGALLRGGMAIEADTGFPRPFEQALTLQALMTANRYEHFAKLRHWAYSYFIKGRGLIDPERLWTSKPDVLVLDRYWLSGLVYGLADGLDEGWLLAVHAALPPAHHVVIDVDPVEALRRRPEARDRYERDRAKQEKVRDIYRATCEAPPSVLQGRVWKVDGMGTMEEVAERVWDVVEKLVQGGSP